MSAARWGCRYGKGGILQTGFETEEVREGFLGGAPGFLDALQRAVAASVAARGGG